MTDPYHRGRPGRTHTLNDCPVGGDSSSPTFWCRDEVLRRVLTDVANELRDRGALNEEECFIDATFVMAKGGGLEIGATKRGKGMKIMAIVDRPWIAALGQHARGEPCDAGSSSASPPGFNGSAGSSFAGSTTPTISSALSSLPASLFSSNDFETGSSLCLPCRSSRMVDLMSLDPS